MNVFKKIAFSLVISFGVILSSCAQDNRPNIILIIGDDISIDDFGCYGHPTIRTPNIDKLAQESTRFTNAYLTTAVCSPTRCSVITGRYPHNTGAPELHQGLPEGQFMFPKALKDAGYYSAQAGKWHLGDYPEQAFDKTYVSEHSKHPGGEEQWVQSLQERTRDKPFFMWFASFDAHRSWQADDQGESHKEEDVIIPPYLLDNSTTRQDLVNYYNEIQRLDRCVGDVIQELKNQKVWDNTVLIFMADNGRPFPRSKKWLFDSGIKTPFIVRAPERLANLEWYLKPC